MSVKAVLAGLAQAVSPSNETPAFGGGGYSAQTPAGAHYLVPEHTGDLETGSLGSCSISICVTLRVTSHLGLSILTGQDPSPAVPHLQVLPLTVSREAQVPVCQG